jgi:hypothetical protein
MSNSQKFEELIKGKRVVICGPAPYLNTKNNGKNIDSYDVVVRVNKGHNLIQNPKVFGSRTDVLYHCISENPEDGGKITKNILDSCKFIVAAHPDLTFKDKCFVFNGKVNFMAHKKIYNNFKNKCGDKLVIIDKQFYLNLERNIGCKPNTGQIAILDLLKHKPKELYITGFTFFKDGYSKLYRSKIDGVNVTEENSKFAVIKRMTKARYKGRHNQYMIFKYVGKILRENSDCVKIDDELRNILSFDIDKYREDCCLDGKSEEEVFNHYLLN